MCTPWFRYVPSLAFLLLVLLLLLPVVSPAAAGDTLEDTSTNAIYRAALEREASGHHVAALEAYERVLARAPDHRAARRALGYEKVDGHWQRDNDLMRAKGFVRHEGCWMTAEEAAAATRPERDLHPYTHAQREGEQQVLGLLAAVASEEPDRVREAKRRMATAPRRFRLAPLTKALRCEPVSLRVYAAGELGRLGDALARPALLRRAIDDPAEAVRHGAVDALGMLDAPGTIPWLGRALWSRHVNVRVRAAEALGRLGNEQGIPYVIARWAKRSGDFTRVYFAQVDQTAYVQDFDVEIASTSFIADPIVGVLQEGVVLDVHVLATEQTSSTIERVPYRETLRRLTGRDLGADVAAWRRWWRGRTR